MRHLVQNPLQAPSLAALSVAERVSAVENETLTRWPTLVVEPKPDAGVIHASHNGVRYVIALAFTSFRSGNVMITRHDSHPSAAQMIYVEGPAQHVANEVAEAMEQHLGPRQDTA